VVGGKRLIKGVGFLKKQESPEKPEITQKKMTHLKITIIRGDKVG
jgi:hypothetical protein